MPRTLWRPGVALAAATAALALPALPASATGAGGAHHTPTTTRLYVPPPVPGSVDQVRSLLRHRQVRDAALVAREITTPQAVWFSSGTPAQVRMEVRRTMKRAAHQHAVPTLVAYYLPYRDCGQYSSGGATDTATYEAWIDAFAQGIGDAPAHVVLEPDGLGLVP